MRVTLMGHAGLYIEAGEERILVDPILRNTPIASGTVVYAIKRALSLERMPPPTLIIVTHAHLDHFDPESLNTQSRSTPLVCPNDPELVRSLSELGFHPIALNPWDRHRGRGVEMMATPSAAGIDEVGFVFESEGRRFWHMTDAEPTIADGSKIAAGGITDLVSVKYQPTAQIQGQVFRNLGASFDKRPVVEWLEAACAAQPALAFPYASGIAFQGLSAWNNRYAFPFSIDEIAALLNDRLANQGGRGITPVVGDVIDLGKSLQVLSQASPFIGAAGGSEPLWEPIEQEQLSVLDSAADREELSHRLQELLPVLLTEWLALGDYGPLRFFLEYKVVWQLAVHLGSDARLHFAVDFGAPQPVLTCARHPRANYFAHLGAGSLLRVLRGQAGAELFHAAGDLRIYEKILVIKDGAFWTPPIQGWELYDHLPEPLTWYLRHPSRWPIRQTAAMSS